MKRIGILTFHQVANYGAVLQCFALKKIIEDYGFECEIVPYSCKKLKENEKMLKFNKYFPVNCVKFISQFWGNAKKRKAFDYFLKKNCNMKDITGKVDFSIYDAVVVGSDQVWNLKLTNNDFTYFLDKVDGVKKISYAASFGEEEIIDQEIAKMSKCIEEFDFVSVRESMAKFFLNEKGIAAEIVCDPVLTVEDVFWNNLVKSRPFAEEKYVLVYCIEKSQTVLDFAKRIAKEKGCRVIYLNQNMLFKEPGVVYKRGVSPVEFLQYIYHAQYVVTNSFHGTSFAIIFNKQFASDLVWHNKVNMRIKEILQMTDLENRTIQYISENDIEEMYQEIDYIKVKEKLNMYVKKSREFLRQALETGIK